MLMALGAVVFQIAPIGLDEIDHGATASFAAHPVLGDMPPLEFTGEGAEEWKLRGTLLPEFSANSGIGDGLSDVAALHAMRKAGSAVPLVRGDGVNLGWVVLTRVTERSRHLNAQGIGRVIDVEIDVIQTQTPSLAEINVVLLSMQPTNI